MGNSLRLRTTLRRALCAALVGAGCGGSTVTPDAGAPTDIGSDVAVGRPDITPTTDTPDVGVATPDAPDAGSSGECVPSGSTPFSARVSGTAMAFRDAGVGSVTLTETLDLYLPMGRVAGAPVLFAFESGWPQRRLVTLRGTFDASLSAGGFTFDGVYTSDVSFNVRLDGPGGGAVMNITRNLAVATDVHDFVSARVTLCPSGEAPATLTHLTAAAGSLVLRVLPSSPIAAGVDGVRMTADGANVRVSAGVYDGVLVVAPGDPWPVSASISLDLSSLRDVMGRPYVVANALDTLHTTATVTDRAFDAPPPSGAVASTHGASAVRGGLSLGEVRGRQRALVALGDFTAATRVTLRYRWACDAVEGATVALMSTDGSASAFPIELPGGPSEIHEGTASAVRSGPLWLVIEQDQTPNRPGRRPLSACPLIIDDVSPAIPGA